MPLQWGFLKTLLYKHRETEFGKKYKFSQIQSIADFQRNIPIHTWNDMAPYMEKVLKGNTTALFPPGEKFLIFAKTSGTTGEAKFIPYTKTAYSNYNKYWAHSFATKDSPPWCPDGKLLYFPGDPEEGHFGDIPFGAISAKVYAQQPRLGRILFPYPYQIAHIKDYSLRYYTIMRLTLEHRVTAIGIANPSTILQLFEAARQNAEGIIRDIREGTLSEEAKMPPTFTNLVRHSLKPNPRRADQLEEILKRTGDFLPKDYWDNPIAVVCFASGPLKLYLQRLRNYHDQLYIYDSGLLASEGNFSFSLGMAKNFPGCCLTLESNFFEFIPEEQGDDPSPEVLTLDQLERGKRYFIIVTNYSGLYRYNISDVVEVTGFFGKVPLITFCHKGKHFSNITGEKLSEFQITESVRIAEKKLNYFCGDFVVCLHWNEMKPNYSLLKEPDIQDNPESLKAFINTVEEELIKLNVEYQSKRQSLRLGPLSLKIVRNDSLREYLLERQRCSSNLSQFKPRFLFGNPEFETQFPIENEFISTISVT